MLEDILASLFEWRRSFACAILEWPPKPHRETGSVTFNLCSHCDCFEYQLTSRLLRTPRFQIRDRPGQSGLAQPPSLAVKSFAIYRRIYTVAYFRSGLARSFASH